jgi:hypothetical protein
MKITKTITILISALTLINFEAKCQISEEKILQDSIEVLLNKFEDAANLFSSDAMDEIYPSIFPINEEGIDLFYSLCDTIMGVPRIINYIDPEVGEFLKRVIKDELKLSDFGESIPDKKLYLTPNEYIKELKKIYPPGPGRGSGFYIRGEANILHDTKERLSGKKFKIYVLLPISFVGHATSEQGSNLYGFDNQELLFEIYFERVKSKDLVSYSDFGIHEVGVLPNDSIIEMPVNLFTIEPFLSSGFVTGNRQLIENAKDNISFNNSFSINAGINISKKFKPFESDNKAFEVGTGAGLLIYKNSASITNYERIEEYNTGDSEIPYNALNLLKYTYTTKANNVDQSMNLNFLVIPLFTKLHCNLSQNNKLAGYVRTGLDFYIPMNNRNEQKGSVDYVGDFLYKLGNNNVTISTDNILEEHELNILIDNYDNLYGQQTAVTGAEFEANFGINWKNELGIRIDKGNYGLNFGLFVSTTISGIANVNDSPLIEKFGEINPVYAKVEKLMPVTLGVNLAVDLNVNKTKLIRID